jgi:hypothetical protein
VLLQLEVQLHSQLLAPLARREEVSEWLSTSKTMRNPEQHGASE